MNPRRLMKKANIKMPWKKLLPFIIAPIIINLIVNIAFGVIEAIYDLPGFIGGIASILITLLVIAIEYPFIKKMLFREIMRQMGENTRRSAKGMVYTSLRTIIIIFIVAIVIGLIIFLLSFNSSGGGLQYFQNQAAIANEVLDEDLENIDIEDVVFDWGDFSDEAPKYENGWGGIVEGVNEANILVEFALNEAKYYEDSGIRGGQRYWDWARANGKGLAFTGSGVYYKNGQYYWEWCANFVAYCIYESGLGNEDSDTFGNILKCSGIHGANALFKYMVDNLGFKETVTTNGSTYEPQPGDIVLFCGSDGLGDHIGIVAGTNGSLVQTVEGNTTYSPCDTSIVDLKEYTYSKPTTRKSGWPIIKYATPPYKVTGGMSLNSYEKGPNGYYIDLEQIMFDYFSISKAYSPAVISGLMANLSHESGGKYDVVEAGYGKVWTTSNFTTDGSGTKVTSFETPDRSYNGNWIEFGTNGEYEEALKYPYNFYTDVPIKLGSGKTTRKYGMGVGIVQWSQGRRSAYYNFCINNGYEYKGPECLISQIEFLDYELANGAVTSSQYDKIFNVPNTADGAYDCAAYFCHYFERPNGHSPSNSNPSQCSTCRTRGELARSTFESYKNRVPSISYGQTTVIPAGTTDIGNVTFIGDSNMVRLAKTNTLKNARKIIATVGVGVNSWDSSTKSTAGSTTIPGKTIKKTIEELDASYFDHVLIMLGTNDWSIDETTFKTKYKDILNLIKNKNRNSIINICTILPVRDECTSTIKMEDVNRVNGWINDIVTEYSSNGAILFDLNSYISASDISDDGIHLNTSGTITAATTLANNCR